MFDYLQIYDRRERWLVGYADLALAPFGDINGWRRVHSPETPRRLLLLRLERIGDLLMTLGAVTEIRDRLPEAHIRLVVGSWNVGLAHLFTGVDEVETLDAPWLARGTATSSIQDVIQTIAGWRREDFDVAINFEPDIRSNALVAASGAPRRVGYATGGGGAFLTDTLDFDPTLHTATNAQQLVAHVAPPKSDDARPFERVILQIPEDARRRAHELLGPNNALGPLVGMNVSAGRPIKQWPAERFAETGSILAREENATIVLLGAPEDRTTGDAVLAALPTQMRPVDLIGKLAVVELAGVLERLALLVSGDTGPMHLAVAVGTPVTAVFGPSDPVRYAPLTSKKRVVSTDLWCRPCNRIRRPPTRCTSGTPDCLTGVTVAAVVHAARELLHDHLPTKSSS